MAKIEKLTVEIRPYYYQESGEMFEILVDVVGWFPKYNEKHYRQAIYKDDFRSRFEQIMEYAKRAVLELDSGD